MVTPGRRVLDEELDELAPELPAIVIEGAKGIGKTFSARRRAATVHSLDDPDQLELAQADPRRLLLGDGPVLIDEWQRLPAIWDLVRRAVDDGARGGRFILAGSASPPPLLGLHSGAGRIVSLRMRPLTLAERGIGASSVSLRQLLAGERPQLGGRCEIDLEGYTVEIVRSGFPGLRGFSDRALAAQLDSYLLRATDRDLPAETGLRVRNPVRLRGWMEAYAAATATTASFETIRLAVTGSDGRRPAKTTAIPYRDALERLWLLDPVPPWLPTRNRLSRVSGSVKHHLADPALAARLLGVGPGALLDAKGAGPPVPRDGTLLGALFESLVALCVRVYAQAAEARTAHFRTWSGDREVDLIVERPDGKVVAIEVKLASSIKDRDVRDLLWLRDALGSELLDAIVITTGPEAYRRADGIGVVPAALLGP